MRVDVVRRSPVSSSGRARQLESIFDVPRVNESVMEWHGEFPHEDEPWNVGLIVGPSGAGKSTVLRECFGDTAHLKWGKASVIDDFADSEGIEAISQVCQAVGFNTIPAWLRPYQVLSVGEQFRVGLARLLLETTGDIVIDEFTSVVDRQVAKIGAHAAQKWVRRHDRRLVAATCHYDVVDWLQPDWVFEPATMTFTRRSVQPRPPVECVVAPLSIRAWQLFAPYHYLTADLHKAARCWGLWVGNELASFGGVLHRPHPKTVNVKGFTRLVTLPDWQGLGLIMVLSDAVGSVYRGAGFKFHSYPAHPAFVRAFDRSPNWTMLSKPGMFNPPGRTSRFAPGNKLNWRKTVMGTRPNAIFRYIGPALEAERARELLTYWN